MTRGEPGKDLDGGGWKVFRRTEQVQKLCDRCDFGVLEEEQEG